MTRKSSFKVGKCADPVVGQSHIGRRDKGAPLVSTSERTRFNRSRPHPGTYRCRLTRLRGSPVVLPCLPDLKTFDRRIPAPSQGGIDALQHEIVHFDPLIESDLAE
jgi:hypothetical protein